MSEIGPIGHQRIPLYERQPAQLPSGRIGSTPTRGGDRVELSLPARLLSRLNQSPEIRQDLVDRVRAEIEAGTYDTSDKIEALIPDLLADLD